MILRSQNTGSLGLSKPSTADGRDLRSCGGAADGG